MKVLLVAVLALVLLLAIASPALAFDGYVFVNLGKGYNITVKVPPADDGRGAVVIYNKGTGDDGRTVYTGPEDPYIIIEE